MPASPAAYWKAPAVAALIRRARAGDTWLAIGLAFYPHARNPRRVRTAASEIFRRYAGEEDRRVRAAAVRARNWNRNPGLSRRAEGMRRRRGLDDAPVMRERGDPLGGLGECFA